MNLKGIVLSEISQRKMNTGWSHLHVESKNAKLIDTDTRMMVARAWELGEMGRCWSKGTNFQL